MYVALSQQEIRTLEAAYANYRTLWDECITKDRTPNVDYIDRNVIEFDHIVKKLKSEEHIR